MPRRVPTRAVRRTVTAAALALTCGAALVVPAAASGAATAKGPRGAAYAATQDTTHRLTVRGWAYDSRRPSTPVVVQLWSNGRLLGKARASLPNHRFSASLALRHKVGVVVARSYGVGRTLTFLNRRGVAQVRATTSQRIVAVAKRYVGRARYAEGGATPARGFDCSGYTKYVYAAAGAGTLPHSAHGQSRVSGMRRVSESHARPGDLVFYHSGGSIFHVAIYAGRHMQYAAATPRDGIRHQRIWSSAVTFGHLGR